MCEFPSWIETEDKTVVFLTDKDLSDFAPENQHDAVGHHGIRKVYPDIYGLEGEGFPCPSIIASAMRGGRMRELMRLFGYKSVYVSPSGELHRDDGPAVEFAHGTKLWYRNGVRHRDDGPAAEWANGTKSWYRNGKKIKEPKNENRETVTDQS